MSLSVSRSNINLPLHTHKKTFVGGILFRSDLKYDQRKQFHFIFNVAKQRYIIIWWNEVPLGSLSLYNLNVNQPRFIYLFIYLAQGQAI